MHLEQFGWSPFFAEAFKELTPGLSAGRVAMANRGICRLWTGNGKVVARAGGAQQVVAGDWVAYDPASSVIRAVLPRRTKLSRKQAGRVTAEQVLAANVDILFAVTALDGDFNPRRLERYLLMATEGGVEPVIVLNKADLCDDPLPVLRQADRIAMAASRGAAAPEIPVVLLSALEERAAAELSRFVSAGQTAALAGSSGVGKSTIVNRLLGFERQRVEAVRASDNRGRHTTTARELFLLDRGWLLLDTPGLRELEPWAGPESVRAVFEDIEDLAVQCRFSDCRHNGEPGCAVEQAVREGRLDSGRVAGLRKLEAELDHLARKQDPRQAAEYKRKVRQIHKAVRHQPPRQ